MTQTPPDTTRLAMDRTILANERTYQAWLRTGLSALAAGLGVARFLNTALPVWMHLSIAALLISVAIVAFFLASWRYGHLHLRLQALDVDATPLWLVRLMAALLIAVAILALGGVFLAALG